MSGSCPGLVEYFAGNHRSCDTDWAAVEEAVEKGGEPSGIAAAWERFEGAMRAHLAREEEILFPAFEASTGMVGGGPTHVMRAEHVQMRGLLDVMGTALEAGNYDELLDQGDTLLLLIQQHNQKEEHMLYPMAESALASEWPSLHERLEAWSAAG